MGGGSDDGRTERYGGKLSQAAKKHRYAGKDLITWLVSGCQSQDTRSWPLRPLTVLRCHVFRYGTGHAVWCWFICGRCGHRISETFDQLVVLVVHRISYQAITVLIYFKRSAFVDTRPQKPSIFQQTWMFWKTWKVLVLLKITLTYLKHVLLFKPQYCSNFM